jgi:hypothetical protein
MSSIVQLNWLPAYQRVSRKQNKNKKNSIYISDTSEGAATMVRVRRR